MTEACSWAFGHMATTDRVRPEQSPTHTRVRDPSLELAIRDRDCEEATGAPDGENTTMSRGGWGAGRVERQAESLGKRT